MKPLLILAALLINVTTASAVTSDELMHISAHFGGVYAMTHATEVICTKIAGIEFKTVCTIGAVIVSNSINIAYKAKQDFPNDTKRAIASGLAGSVIAASFIVIDW